MHCFLLFPSLRRPLALTQLLCQYSILCHATRKFTVYYYYIYIYIYLYSFFHTPDLVTFTETSFVTCTGAVHRNFQQMPNSETEMYIKDWLRNAKDRGGGRQKRMTTMDVDNMDMQYDDL